MLALEMSLSSFEVLGRFRYRVPVLPRWFHLVKEDPTYPALSDLFSTLTQSLHRSQMHSLLTNCLDSRLKFVTDKGLSKGCTLMGRAGPGSTCEE